MTDNQKGWLKIAVAFTIIIFFLVKCEQNPQPPSDLKTDSKKIEIGNIYPTVGVSYSCPTDANFEKMIQLLDVNDYQGIEAMKWAVEIVPLPKKTNVKVMDMEGRKIKVMVIDGFYKNSIVYVMYGSLVE